MHHRRLWLGKDQDQPDLPRVFVEPFPELGHAPEFGNFRASGGRVVPPVPARSTGGRGEDERQEDHGQAGERTRPAECERQAAQHERISTWSLSSRW